MRILGIDPGEVRLGLAVSDELGLTAQGLPTWVSRGRSADLAHFRSLVKELDVAEVVVGLPRNMDGTLGPRAEAARELARDLGDTLGLPVTLWDERLTTQAATRALTEAGLSRRRRRGRVDAVAAALILQGYLDRTRASRREEAG
ncbi:MAG: Holliday junction resolvase RuvX [candidate division NC10 bacterium]|nr:Holliday junction resolvase RuvX [candidate division NC10 bacterium]